MFSGRKHNRQTGRQTNGKKNSSEEALTTVGQHDRRTHSAWLGVFDAMRPTRTTSAGRQDRPKKRKNQSTTIDDKGIDASYSLPSFLLSFIQVVYTLIAFPQKKITRHTHTHTHTHTNTHTHPTTMCVPVRPHSSSSSPPPKRQPMAPSSHAIRSTQPFAGLFPPPSSPSSSSNLNPPPVPLNGHHR